MINSKLYVPSPIYCINFRKPRDKIAIQIILGPGIQPPGQRLAATETETSSSMMSSEIESSIYESEDVQSQGKQDWNNFQYNRISIWERFWSFLKSFLTQDSSLFQSYP